jgi:hypothetical protein
MSRKTEVRLRNVSGKYIVIYFKKQEVQFKGEPVHGISITQGVFPALLPSPRPPSLWIARLDMTTS